MNFNSYENNISYRVYLKEQLLKTAELLPALTDIKIQITTAKGVNEAQQTVKYGETLVQLRFTDLNPGSYLITINSSQGSYSKVEK